MDLALQPLGFLDSLGCADLGEVPLEAQPFKQYKN